MNKQFVPVVIESLQDVHAGNMVDSRVECPRCSAKRPEPVHISGEPLRHWEKIQCYTCGETSETKFWRL